VLFFQFAKLLKTFRSGKLFYIISECVASGCKITDFRTPSQ